jgi:hypothetical protein
MLPQDLLMLKDDRAAIKEEMDALSLQLSEKEAALTKAIEDLQAGFRLQNAGLIESVTVAEREFERKDKELRAAVVAAYTANPASKTVASGLSVRVTEKPVLTMNTPLLGLSKSSSLKCSRLTARNSRRQPKP